LYAEENNIEVDITDLTVKSFMKPRKTLVLPYFLTRDLVISVLSFLIKINRCARRHL